RGISSAVTGFAILIASPAQTRVKLMIENEKYLNEAHTRAKEFETQLEPERLREAYIALDNIVLEREHDSRSRIQLRKKCLSLWLHLIQLLDHSLDSDFNP